MPFQHRCYEQDSFRQTDFPQIEYPRHSTWTTTAMPTARRCLCSQSKSGRRTSARSNWGWMKLRCFMTKPISPDELLTRIGHYLSQSNERR